MATTPNYADSIAPKPSVAIREQSTPPPWFVHSPPALPSGLTLPTYPGTLNAAERAEVERYILNPTDAVLATLSLPDAIAKANQFKTRNEDPKYRAWLASSEIDKIAQWRDSVGSGVAANDGAVPVSLDVTGVGTPRSGDVIPPGDDDSSCSIPTLELFSGTIGGAATFALGCDTPGSVIHWKLGAGAYSIYYGHISLTGGQVITWYGTAPGFIDSDTDTFTNS
jgi:hypothetical protein